MKKSYEVIMDKIVVTEEMRKRILRNIQTVDLVKPLHFLSSFRKYLPLAACLAVVLIGAVVFQKYFVPPEPAPTPFGASVQKVMEITEFSTAKELSETVGFEITDLSSLPITASHTTYLSFGQELAQIEYTDGNQTITFRKSSGSEDNSGDYTAYSITEIQKIKSNFVTLKGENGLYHLALWEKNGFSYSLRCSESITSDQMKNLIVNIE